MSCEDVLLMIIWVKDYHKEALFWMVSLRLQKLWRCVPEVDLPEGDHYHHHRDHNDHHHHHHWPSKKYWEERNCRWCDPGQDNHPNSHLTMTMAMTMLMMVGMIMILDNDGEEWYLECDHHVILKRLRDSIVPATGCSIINHCGKRKSTHVNFIEAT